MKNNYIIIFITVPQKNADKIIKHLLAKKLVACVNKISLVESTYWWEGKICNDKESLLIIKTKKSLFKKIIIETKKVHPYTVPEIISLPITDGNKDYLKWICQTTKSGSK